MPIRVWFLFLATFLVINSASCQLNEFSVWLCGYSRTENEVYPHPVDCYRYVHCREGYPLVTMCPLGMYFVTSDRQCKWPTRARINQCDGSIEAYSNRVCQNNYYATIPLPDTCALYLNCGHNHGNPMFYERLLECSYPDLYDIDRRRCTNYQTVSCGTRPIPIAPCDYLQYQQTCPTPGACTPCYKRHPSCRYHSDGPHKVEGHRKLFKLCTDQRTLDVRKCVSTMEYRPSLRMCAPSKIGWM